MEVDFGESWVDIAGVPCKVKYLVATLPFSNAYFAKAYPVERLESLLDGIESAFPLLRGARGPPRARQHHLAGRQGRVGRSGPGADRGVRGVPGRVAGQPALLLRFDEQRDQFGRGHEPHPV